MTWGAVGAATIGVVGGAILSNNSRNAATNAANQSADLAKEQARIASEQDARYKELYLPMEQDMVAEAKNAGSAQEYAQAAGDASATVAEQFGKARERMARTPGLDPSTPGAAATMAGLDLAQAATDATSQNAARMGVKNAAWAKKSGMLGMGKGLDTTASAGLASAAGSLNGVANYNGQLASQTAAGFGQFVSNVAPSVIKYMNTPSQPVTLGAVPALQTPDYSLGGGKI